MAKLSNSLFMGTFEVLATPLEVVEKEVSGVSRADNGTETESLRGDLNSESTLLALNLNICDVSCAFGYCEVIRLQTYFIGFLEALSKTPVFALALLSDSEKLSVK